MKKMFVVFALVLLASCSKKEAARADASTSQEEVDLAEDTTPTMDAALPVDTTPVDQADAATSTR